MPISPLKFNFFGAKTKISPTSNPIKDNKDCTKPEQNSSFNVSSIYPNALFLISDFNIALGAEQKKYIPSQLRFLETIEKNYPLRTGHFEDFLGDKHKILPENFFVKMKHYKKDLNWAKDTENLVYFVSDLISQKNDFDEIISMIAFGVNYTNDKNVYGVLKSYSPSMVSSKGYSIEKNKRGEEYLEKFIKKVKKPYSPNPGSDYRNRANVLTIYPDKKTDSFLVLYPDYEMYNESNLEIVKEIYNELTSKENPSEKEIVETAAKIQWLIAQETPYIKGSDSVANILTRSILHAYRLPVYPLKEGVSLDFEAWYQDMDKYVKNYMTYFDKNA